MKTFRQRFYQLLQLIKTLRTNCSQLNPDRSYRRKTQFTALDYARKAHGARRNATTTIFYDLFATQLPPSNFLFLSAELPSQSSIRFARKNISSQSPHDRIRFGPWKSPADKHNAVSHKSNESHTMREILVEKGHKYFLIQGRQRTHVPR